jgi:hypothetical protein
MNKAKELLKLFESDASWEDVVKTAHDKLKVGEVVIITKPYGSNSRIVYTLGNKYLSTYDMRNPKEVSIYKQRYKEAL